MIDVPLALLILRASGVPKIPTGFGRRIHTYSFGTACHHVDDRRARDVQQSRGRIAVRLQRLDGREAASSASSSHAVGPRTGPVERSPRSPHQR